MDLNRYIYIHNPYCIEGVLNTNSLNREVKYIKVNKY